MTKLVAIVRHEYLKRVRSVGFIVSTVLGPLLLAATFIIPVLIAFMQPAALRVAVLDQSGRMCGVPYLTLDTLDLFRVISWIDSLPSRRRSTKSYKKTRKDFALAAMRRHFAADPLPFAASVINCLRLKW